MENKINSPDSLHREIVNSLGLIKLLLFVVAANIGFMIIYFSDSKTVAEIKVELIKSDVQENSIIYWSAPDTAELTHNSDKKRILYGQDLIKHTSFYYGETGIIAKSTTNGMNCQNCHLEGGTKVFGNNYAAVASTYPKYRARSGAIETMDKRINDCFERSLNGMAIDPNSKEMQSMIIYMKWLGKEVVKGVKPAGSGLKDLAFLDRAANPENGEAIYFEKCKSCHLPNGEGLLNQDQTAFTYPPLWGSRSYNDGAGLYRISNFARFVKYNMPFGTAYNNTQLTDEEAWDVAAFVNSRPRPVKNKINDWPKIEEKPFDYPFGPYTDGFDEKQHKFGPFLPIQKKINQLKKEKV